MSSHDPDSREWLRRVAQAEEAVRAMLDALPPALRPLAKKVPVEYQPEPSEALIADGIEADSLGLFVGATHDEADSGVSSLPPKIVLFLGNLWDYADEDREVFEEEVQTTYLHELGHYLGLDEEELFDRGLE